MKLFTGELTMRLTLAMLATCAALPAHAQDAFPAVLAGHAYLPAFTLVPPPADAPRDAMLSGKFTGKSRNDTAMSAPADTGKNYGAHPRACRCPSSVSRCRACRALP